MLLQHTSRRLVRTTAAGALAVSAIGLSACSQDTAGPETGTDVEDVQQPADDVGPYDGAYDAGFSEDLGSYDGEQVTVSADVNEVISPSSFTIAGTDDTTVEPLLVVSATQVNDLQPDLAVAVKGTVHEAFDLASVEDELGVDLDDALFEGRDGEPYISASNVDTSVPADQ